jgi:hypothetical protein
VASSEQHGCILLSWKPALTEDVRHSCLHFRDALLQVAQVGQSAAIEKAPQSKPIYKSIFLRQRDGFLRVRTELLWLAPIKIEVTTYYQRETYPRWELVLTRMPQTLFSEFGGLADPAKELENQGEIAREPRPCPRETT